MWCSILEPRNKPADRLTTVKGSFSPSGNIVLLDETCVDAYDSGTLSLILANVKGRFYSVGFGKKPAKGETVLQPRKMLCSDRIGRIGTPTCAVVGGRAYDFAKFKHHSTCDVVLWKRGRRAGLADPAFRVWNAHTTVWVKVDGVTYFFRQPEGMTDAEYRSVLALAD